MSTSTSNATMDSQDASQDIDSGAMQVMMEQHKKTVKDRRRVRENSIKQAHKQRFEELNRKIEKAGDTHEEQIKAIQLAQVQRLSGLMARKKSLEQAIERSLDEMEMVFDTAAQHLDAGVRGRIEGLRSVS